MRLFGGLFWGIFLIASGAIFLLRHALNLQVSQGKLIFGVFVVLVGVSLLTTGSWTSRSDGTSVFTDGRITVLNNGGSYQSTFSSTDYDLAELQPGSTFRLNCAFGSARIKLPPGAYEIHANSAFGSVRMPDGTSYAFGSGNFNKSGIGETIRVDVNCSFGEVVLYD